MPQSLQQFGQSIKAKHPEYGDMSDEDVANKVLAKYPQYKDMVQLSAPTTNGATIGASTSDENPLTQFFHEAGQDLSQGGTRTAVGRLLGRLQGRGESGYSGLQSGVSPGTAEIMGSPALGTVHALEGAASTPQHPVMGPLRAVGGVMEAATIPSMMMTGGATGGLIEAVPSRKFAAQNFDRIAGIAGKTEVPLTTSTLDPLQRLAEISANGGAGKVPPGVMQLLERSQGVFPMEYPQARTFVSNLSSLSKMEKMAANPEVGMEVGGLVRGLHGDIASAADMINPGLGQEYMNTVNEYKQASRIAAALKKAAIASAVAGGGAVAGNKAMSLAKSVGGGR